MPPPPVNIVDGSLNLIPREGYTGTSISFGQGTVVGGDGSIVGTVNSANQVIGRWISNPVRLDQTRYILSDVLFRMGGRRVNVSDRGVGVSIHLEVPEDHDWAGTWHQASYWSHLEGPRQLLGRMLYHVNAYDPEALTDVPKELGRTWFEFLLEDEL